MHSSDPDSATDHTFNWSVFEWRDASGTGKGKTSPKDGDFPLLLLHSTTEEERITGLPSLSSDAGSSVPLIQLKIKESFSLLLITLRIT
jgi:hypothetical protein